MAVNLRRLAATYEGKASEPADVVRALQAVAEIKQISEMEVAMATTENAVRVFGLSSTGLESRS
jgi:Tat protein secretion system quality control protein TatD with DNase activity